MNETDTASDLRPMDETGLRPVARARMADAPGWIAEGFQLWSQAPAMLMAMAIVATLLFVGAHMVPFLGVILAMVFWVHLAAGIYLGYRRVFEGRPVTLGVLFQPFRSPGTLAGAGGVYLGLSLLASVIFFVMLASQLGMAEIEALMTEGDAAASSKSAQEWFAALAMPGLIFVGFMVLITMAFLFAPILIHQHGQGVWSALTLSLKACVRNLPAFILLGLCWFGILLLLGLLQLVPILGPILWFVISLGLGAFVIGSLYAAYLDLFIRA